MGWTTKSSWFNSQKGQEIFLLSKTSRLALEPTLLCIKWVSRALSMGTKQPAWEADQSPPSYDMFQVRNSILTYLLTPWSRALLEKLTGSQHFMEPEGSLPHSQVSATCPHSQPDQSSPCPHFLKMHFNIILSPQAWVFQVVSFPEVSPP